MNFILIGKAYFSELNNFDSILSSLFFALFTLVMSFWIIAILIPISINSFHQAKEELHGKKGREEYSLLEYIYYKTKVLISILQKNYENLENENLFYKDSLGITE